MLSLAMRRLEVGPVALMRMALIFLGTSATLAVAQITMDTHVQSTGAFSSRGGSAGIISGNVEYRSTVQLPLDRSVVVGGTAGDGTSGSRGGGLSSQTATGGGTFTEIRVREVPVDPVGLREEPLPKWSGKELVLALDSQDPSLRFSVLAEIARRRWSPKARAWLTRRLGICLRDE
jgi:hypothetical protein